MTTRPNDKRKKHRATGKPMGGARPGAGRPEGTPNLLPYGAIPAIKSLNMRQPKDLTEGQRTLLQASEDAIVKVMKGQVHGSVAGPVLKAAVTVREEIIGPIAKKMEVKADVGLTDMLDEMSKIEGEEKHVVPTVPAKGPIVRKAAAAVTAAAVAAEAKKEE
jgi:hypothetical protein